MKKIMHYLLATPLFVIMIIKLMIKIITGQGTVYRNVTWFGDGKPVRFEELVQTFSIEKRHCYFNSERGPIIMIHGNPDGSFYLQGDKVSLQTICELDQIKGTWNMISCYNKFHEDHYKGSYGAVHFIKDDNLNKEWPVFALPVCGNLYCYSGKSVQGYVELIALLQHLFG